MKKEDEKLRENTEHTINHLITGRDEASENRDNARVQRDETKNKLMKAEEELLLVRRKEREDSEEQSDDIINSLTTERDECNEDTRKFQNDIRKYEKRILEINTSLATITSVPESKSNSTHNANDLSYCTAVKRSKSTFSGTQQNVSNQQNNLAADQNRAKEEFNYEEGAKTLNACSSTASADSGLGDMHSLYATNRRTGQTCI